MAPNRSILELALQALSRHFDKRGIDENTAHLLRSSVSETDSGRPIHEIAQMILDRELGFRQKRPDPARAQATALSELSRAEAIYQDAASYQVETARELYLKAVEKYNRANPGCPNQGNTPRD